MTVINITSPDPQKPAAPVEVPATPSPVEVPATPQQQTQGNPNLADKPGEQQK